MCVCVGVQGRLPLTSELLGECAMNCRAYAKALHYKEEEFHHGLTTMTLESLISINNKLQQPDAAAGVLVFAQKKAEGEFVSVVIYCHYVPYAPNNSLLACIQLSP